MANKKSGKFGRMGNNKYLLRKRTNSDFNSFSYVLCRHALIKVLLAGIGRGLRVGGL